MCNIFTQSVYSENSINTIMMTSTCWTGSAVLQSVFLRHAYVNDTIVVLFSDFGTTSLLFTAGCAVLVLGILIFACHFCAKKKLLWFKNKSKLPTAASEPHLAFYHRKPTTAVKAVKNPNGSHYLKKSPSPTGSKTPVVSSVWVVPTETIIIISLTF